MFSGISSVGAEKYAFEGDITVEKFVICGNSDKELLSISFGNGVLDIKLNGPRTEAAEAFFDYLRQYYGLISGQEVRAVLIEVHEFIRDRDKPVRLDQINTTLLYTPPPTELQIQEEAIKEAQGDLEQMKRETALRKRIDKLLKQLEKGDEP